MKTLTFFFLVLCGLFLITCKKDNPGGEDNSLTGKWKLTETLDDPGNGSGQWRPVDKKAQYDYVTFGNDGKLAGTVFANYVSYAVKDSITLTFTANDNVIQNYFYKIQNGTLTMSPAGPIRCIEGCGIRFNKAR